MYAAELMAKIIASSADEKGIRDRFGDNADLFGYCFCEFLEEPSFEVLHEAMDQCDYSRAFEAAHALKGVSGNLGVTAFYKAVCLLVESLRAGSYTHAEEQYAQTLCQREKLVRIRDGCVQLTEKY